MKFSNLPKLFPYILCLAIISGTVVLSESVSFGMIEVGTKYKPFKGKDLNGKTVNIDDYIGKKTILLKFGSIYCSTCVSSLKDVGKISKKVGSENLQVIGINLDVYGVSRVKRFYRGYEKLIFYPMIIDEKLKISTSYRVQVLPAHAIIDKKGIVRYVSTGAGEKDIKELETIVTKIIRGEKEIEKFAKAQPFELFLPQNFSKTVQDSIYIVGKTKYKDADITLTLNGGMKQFGKTMREFFYLRTPLSLGSNYIEVQIQGRGLKTIQQGLVLFREPKIGLGIESPFPEYYFHTESNEKLCKKCHDLNPPKSGSQGFAIATRFCLSCHEGLGGKKYIHGPVPVGGCSPCHDFSSMPNKYQVVAFGQDLCFTCHENHKQELLKEYLHGPLSAGICVVCHDPHGSNEKYQLRKYVGDLCMMCHADAKTEMFRTAVHKPFQDGQCSQCHLPHSSARRDFFMRFPGSDLCLSCHRDNIENHLHPYGRPPGIELNVKLDKEGNLTCLSCHDPHASDEGKLLPKGGCNYCHAS